MKLVTISMELVIDDDIKESFIPEYLNDKLYTDPEFFGDFGPENITGVVTVVEQSDPYWVLCVLLFCSKWYRSRKLVGTKQPITL